MTKNNTNRVPGDSVKKMLDTKKYWESRSNNLPVAYGSIGNRKDIEIEEKMVDEMIESLNVRALRSENERLQNELKNIRETRALSLEGNKGMLDVVDWIRWFVKNVSDQEDFRWKAMTAAADRIEELEDEVFWLKDELEKAQAQVHDEKD